MKDRYTFSFQIVKSSQILQLDTTSNSVFAYKFSKSKMLANFVIVSYIFTFGTIY